MKLYIILIASLLLLSFTKDSNCKSKLRTDGYYIYKTNLNDTFAIVPNSREDWLAATKMVHDKMGLAPLRKSSCLPDSVIFTGGPFINYIAFFNDSVGTSIVTQCTDSATHNHILNLIENRRNSNDTTRLKDVHKVYDVNCTDENVIEFYVSEYDFFKTKHSGVITRDSLVLRVYDEDNPYTMYDEDFPRVYYFHEFQSRE